MTDDSAARPASARQSMAAADDEAVTLHLRVGAELLQEPWSTEDTASARGAAERLGGIDGGLRFGPDDAPACRSDLWDQLDGLLLSWIEAFDALAGGASEAEVRFPDARIEVDLWRDAELVRIRYEDIDTAVAPAAARAGLLAAGGRLTKVFGRLTPAMSQLADRIAQEQG